MARGGVEYSHEKNMVETMKDIRDSMSPWKWSALWKSKGECFYKVRRDGTIRLYRTSEGIGFCWADMKVAPIRGGGTAMILKTAADPGMKFGAWLLCVMAILLVARDWVNYGGAMFVRDLPYLLVAAAALLLIGMAGRETPKVVRYIEQELGWKRAR